MRLFHCGIIARLALFVALAHAPSVHAFDIKWTSPISNQSGKTVISISRIPNQSDLILEFLDYSKNIEGVVRLNSMGFPVWESQLNLFIYSQCKPIQSTPSTVFFSGVNNDYLYCLDLQTGSTTCTISNMPGLDYDPYMAQPIIWNKSGDEMMIVAASQHVSHLSAESTTILENATLLPTVANASPMKFLGPPLVAGGHIFFPVYDWQDSKSSLIIGSQVTSFHVSWSALIDDNSQFELGSFMGLAANRAMLYYMHRDVQTNETWITARSTKDGLIIWKKALNSIPDMAAWTYTPKMNAGNNIIVDQKTIYISVDAQQVSSGNPQPWPLETAVVALDSMTGEFRWISHIPYMFDIRQSHLNNRNELVIVGSAIQNPYLSPWQLTAKKLPSSAFGEIAILHARNGKLMDSMFLPSLPLSSRLYQNGIVISYENETIQYVDFGQPTFEKPGAPWPTPNADGYNSRISRDTAVPPEMMYLRTNP